MARTPIFLTLKLTAPALVFPCCASACGFISSSSRLPLSQCWSSHVTIFQAVSNGAPLEDCPAIRCSPLRGLYFLVCAHSQRDSRCDMCGPPLAAWLSAAGTGAAGLSTSSVSSPSVSCHVLKCSHIGGHRHAANVIVYAPVGATSGTVSHWFGCVNSEALAKELVAHYQRVAAGEASPDTLPPALVPLWRGDNLLSPAQALAKCWGALKN